MVINSIKYLKDKNQVLEFGSDASLHNACDYLLFQILLFEIGI